MPAEEPRWGLRVWLVAFAGVLGILALTGPWSTATDAPPPATPPVLQGDGGDKPASTTFDGPMVRERPAIAIHTVSGVDRDKVRAEVRAAAEADKVGPLADATFAVFSEELLRYLVPEVTLVLPETASVLDAEALMRDHTYTGVTFYLVDDVLVHDVTFAVLPQGVTGKQVTAPVAREGILSDSLGSYRAIVQPVATTVRYFGALLSDVQILAVRDSLGRAANVPVERVYVEPMNPGPGIDLSNGHPANAEAEHGHS